MSETCSNCWGVRNLFSFKLLGFQKLAQIAGVSETCLILGCQKPVQIGVSETCSNCWGVRNLLTDVVGDAVGLTDTVVEMGFDYFYFEILISY